MNKLIFAVVVAFLMQGCTYEERIALGAVAGAATGALIADSTTPYYGYDYGYRYDNHGHYYRY